MTSMLRASRSNAILVSMFSLLLVSCIPAYANGHDGPDRAERESTYPEAIEAITHSPWNVTRGEPFEVTVTLDEDGPRPEAMNLIWCRLEPDYVCAMPETMQPAGGGMWTVTVPDQSESIVTDETRHVGYNVSLRYEPEEGGTPQRVYAPTHNTWLPPTFPQGTDGNYYFIALDEPQRSIPALPLVPVLGFLLLILGLLHSPRAHRATRETRSRAITRGGRPDG